MVWNDPATDSIQVLKRGRCEQRHKVGSRSVKQISTLRPLPTTVAALNANRASARPIHDIEMKPVRAHRRHGARLFAKLGEIGREDGGSDESLRHLMSDSGHPVGIVLVALFQSSP